MFLLSTQDIPHFLEAAKLEGIEPRIEDVEGFAKKNRVLLLRHVATDTAIDVSLGILPFEQEVIERSSLQEFDDSLQVRLPSNEDLIIMKALPRRPRDLEDIRSLVAKYPDLDIARIENWVKSFGEFLDVPEMWGQIQAILKD